MKSRLTEEERERIADLIYEGKTIREICMITDRSPNTVVRIRAEVNSPEALKSQKTEVAMMLRKYWHWKIPERKPQKTKDTGLKKRSKYFRTPYHH